MHNFLVSAVALTGLVAAAPSSKGFTINQVDSGRVHRKNGAREIARAHHKFNATIPSVILSAAAGKQSGSVVATPEANDRSYLCPVQIGTPPKTLMLDFDTGSSDLWVFSSLQPAAQSKGHSTYNPSSSSSGSKLDGYTWSIQYADTSGAKGVVYQDVVDVGGATATKQAVEAATSVSSSFKSDKMNDGLLGLAGMARNTVKPKKVQTFYGNIAATLPSKLFTATLKHNAPGSYDFGFIDSSKYTGALTYTPIARGTDGAGVYEFAVSSYSVGSTAYNTPFKAIADTGTTLILIQAATVKNYYAQVPQSQNNAQVGGYIYPCSDTLPDFTLNIGGASHTVPGSLVNFVEVGTISGVAYCYGGIQSSGNLPFAILGDVFLKSVFAVFDVGAQRIGFAAQA